MSNIKGFKKLELTQLHHLFKYDNKQSLLALYEQVAVEDIPPLSALATISVSILFNGLIKIPGGFITRFIYNRLSIQKKFLYCHGVVEQMVKHNQLHSFFAGTMVHMVNGVDQYDPKSAGGWDSKEFTIFLHILDQAGYTYTPQPLVDVS